MSGFEDEFLQHAGSGATTMCRAWAITRRDGATFGFTDHDRDLSFDGITFKADTGLSALALSQSTGLSIDNTEAIGALTDVAVREDDIDAGRFDGADVRAWLVNWANPAARHLQFRGSIGEIKRAGGAFNAELRGLAEKLNKPTGRIYQKPCTAVLGDTACGFDINSPGYFTEIKIERVENSERLTWAALPGFEEGWFANGRLDVLDGTGAGLWSTVRSDTVVNGQRTLDLWEPVRARLVAGQRVRLSAGCDKRFETCRLKFGNLINFQGFPDLPGEDWLVAVPKQSLPNTGGSRR